MPRLVKIVIQATKTQIVKIKTPIMLKVVILRAIMVKVIVLRKMRFISSQETALLQIVKVMLTSKSISNTSSCALAVGGT